MALLSRVADRIYWAGRYIERAEDAARVVRSFGDMLADIPSSNAVHWSTLSTIAGAEPTPMVEDGSDEMAVIEFVMADMDHHNSIVRTVGFCRENLRTCREVLPREAWQTVNDLEMYVRANAQHSLSRRQREYFLTRIINDSRRLDGVLTSSMTRDEAFEFWRLGRYLERADMCTRVLGVRAASLLTTPAGQADDYGQVKWMSVLRSLSALQMYERATAGSISGPEVVRFLLFDHRFPRSVAGCLTEIRSSLLRLPGNESVLRAVEAVDRELHDCRPAADDGAALDDALDEVQLALAGLSEAITEKYLQF